MFEMTIFILERAVRGYHVYKGGWDPHVGEELTTKTEDGNPHDRHAVSVMKEGKVVGHLPREVSKVAWYFQKRGGTINMEVIGRRRRSSLEQGGLEIPCLMKFTGNKKLVENLRKLLK